MRKVIVFWLCIVASVLIISCVAPSHKSAPLHQSEQYYDYLQPTFAQYLTATSTWLTQHRAFISADHEQELAMNMPFERGDPNSNKAILLVHGLGDSPYSFHDLAASFVAQGFYVQSLLLPGHGSNPEDMHLSSYQAWQEIVDHYAKLLQQNHQHVWLGGFSTGANLVSIYTLNHTGIEGLVLISPGFKSRNLIIDKLSAFMAVFWDGIGKEEDNLVKYNSISLHGMAQYSKSASIFRKAISHQEISVPTLIVVSEADSIINAYSVADFFSTRFSNPSSKLIWYGEQKQLVSEPRLQTYSMHLNTLKISTASHMSPLFSEENSYYGKNPEHIICFNSLSDEQTERCKQDKNVWFSAWGYKEDGKAYARLTWNPYFEQLDNEITQLLQ